MARPDSDLDAYCFGCGNRLKAADSAAMALCRCCRDRRGGGGLYDVRSTDGGRHGPFPLDGILAQIKKNFLGPEDCVSTPGSGFIPLAEHPDFAAWFLPGDSRYKARLKAGANRHARSTGRRRKTFLVQVMALVGILVFGALPVVAKKTGVTRLPTPWLDWMYVRIERVHDEIINVFKDPNERIAMKLAVEEPLDVPGRDLVKTLKLLHPEKSRDPLALVEAGWEALSRASVEGAREARPLLEKAVAVMPGDSGATGGLALAYRWLVSVDPDLEEPSSILMERAFVMRPHHAATWRARAGIALHAGAFQTAREHTESCLEIAGKDRQCIQWHAESLRGLGLLEEADTWLGRRQDALPDTPGANLLLGRIALARGRHGEALGYLESVRKAEPQMAVAWELLARVYYEAGNLLEARIHAEQAGALEPELLEARLLHARLLLQVEGATEEAWQRLSLLAENTPEDAYLQDRIHVAASHAARASGRLDMAKRHAEQSLVHRTGWGPGRLALAMVEVQRGNMGAVARALQGVDAHTLEGREEVRYHYWVARFQMSQGRFRIAQGALDQALEVDPNWGPLHVAQAHVDLKVGRKDKVIEALETGFLVDLERARLRQRLVLTWFPLEERKSTYTLLFDTFGRSPRHMDDLPKWMGVLRLPECLRTGACDEATSQLVEALKLDRANHAVLTSLGRIALEHGQAMEALSFLERSLATRDTEPLVHTLRARALFSQGDLEGADDSFSKAYHYDRDFAPAHRHHAEALLAAGRFHEGMEHLESALKADPLDAFGRSLLLAHRADIE